MASPGTGRALAGWAAGRDGPDGLTLRRERHLQADVAVAENIDSVFNRLEILRLDGAEGGYFVALEWIGEPVVEDVDLDCAAVSLGIVGIVVAYDLVKFFDIRVGK